MSTKHLAAGRLRHVVSLQQLVTTLDDAGAVSETWQEVAKVFAAIEPLSVREFIAAASLQSKASVRITIRHRDDIRADWRIVNARNGIVYNPQGVLTDVDSNREYLTLPCSQGVNDG